MANTTSYSCYQSVEQGVHWQQGAGGVSLSLAPAPPVVLLQQDQLQPSALQATALLLLAASLTTLLPKSQGRQHFKYTVLKWVSGTDLLICMVGCILSLVTNGINVAIITNNFPFFSDSLLWQPLQLIRLTMMAWFIKQLYGSNNSPNYHHQGRKTSASIKSQTESEFILDFISKSLDKFIIFAVLFASVILFFSSVIYLAAKPVLSMIYKSHFYKSALNHVKHLTSHLTMSLSKHPINRKLMVLVPTSLVISACVSSVQALDYM